MTDFEVGGINYRAGTMNAIKQLQVVRRLAPLLAALNSADLAGLAGQASDGSGAGLAAAIGPLTEAFAAMSDENTEYVLSACLSICQREIPGGLGWTPIWSVQGKTLMFDDINLMVLVQIVGRVVMANVGDFTSALPRTIQAAAAPTR